VNIWPQRSEPLDAPESIYTAVDSPFEATLLPDPDRDYPKGARPNCAGTRSAGGSGNRVPVSCAPTAAVLAPIASRRASPLANVVSRASFGSASSDRRISAPANFPVPTATGPDLLRPSPFPKPSIPALQPRFGPSRPPGKTRGDWVQRLGSQFLPERFTRRRGRGVQWPWLFQPH